MKLTRMLVVRGGSPRGPPGHRGGPAPPQAGAQRPCWRLPHGDTEASRRPSFLAAEVAWFLQITENKANRSEDLAEHVHGRDAGQRAEC